MQTAPPSVFIIVLTWNNYLQTAECLDSLSHLQYPNYRVLVVDNGSTDGSVQALRNRFPEQLFLVNSTNLGFSGGNNAGTRYALVHGAEYVLLLNNDTTVSSDFLDHLVNTALIDPQAGMVCPKIYYQSSPDLLWAAGSCIHIEHMSNLIPRQWKSLSTMLFELRGLNEQDRGQYEKLESVEAAPGAALLVSRELIERVGLLDEQYFLVHEDSDWCWRARKAGFRILYQPASRIWHYVTASSGSSETPSVVYYATRNTLLFTRKHARWHIRLWLYSLSLLIFVKDWLKVLTRRPDSDLTQAKVHAFLDFWAGRYGRWKSGPEKA